jgi:maltokinase
MMSMIGMTHPAAADDRLHARLAGLLGSWLPSQRWFGGKGRVIASVSIASCLRIIATPDGPDLWHVLADVGLDTPADEPREPHTYQVFIGVRRELPERLRHAALGDPDLAVPEFGGVCYDGLHDADLTGWLLERVANRADVGPLRFDRLSGQRLRTDLRSLVLTGEQSNTSLVFGDQYIAKVFRRPAPGRNPELELGLALAVAESEYVAPPIGWAEFDQPGTEPITLLTVQQFLPSATDGWALALTSVRDLFAAEPDISAARAGADFAPEAFRLGEATAQVHAALAATLPKSVLDRDEATALAEGMARHLEATVRRVPALRAYVGQLSKALAELGTLEGTLTVQRVHGDYHLGQAMRTTTGWVLLDFEGEPTRPLSERRSPASPLKDIAGMLRSFDYAAHHLLATLVPQPPELAGSTELVTVRASEWAARNRDAFCRGYAEVTGRDPRHETVALRAFEIDKAVYEVGYEAANRPSWLPIPLAACARLASG